MDRTRKASSRKDLADGQIFLLKFLQNCEICATFPKSYESIYYATQIVKVMEGEFCMIRNKWKKTLTIVLAGTLITAPLASLPLTGTASAAASTSTTVQDQLALISESPITAGASLRSYIWKSTRNNKPIKVNVKAIVVDLSRPNVKLDVMTGTGGQFTKNQTVLGMAKETGAVAGINGDFYNTKADGAPQGPQISQGVVMSSAPFLTGYYSFALTKDKKPIIDEFSFSGQLTAADGATFELGGINKAPYWYGPDATHAMIDSMFIYTSAWGSEIRAVDRATDLKEVLVVDGIVQQIQHGNIKMTPPENGYIIRTEGKARTFVEEHLKVGDPVTYSYKLQGRTSGTAADSTNLELLIGGGTLLVDQGKAVEQLSLPGSADAKSARSRTTIGYSRDGRYVYLVTADQLDGQSDGATLKEMGRLLAQMGVWRALNMDGGGSTQMVARPLGEQTPVIVNGLENAWQRPVVNGLGVYSTAPQGNPAGLIVSGPSFLLKGEYGNYTAKGYDQYYNPLPSEMLANVVWSSSDASAVLKDGNVAFSSSGKRQVTAKLGNVSQNLDVQVISANDIDSMTILTSSSIALDNSTVKLSVKIRTKSGAERTVSGQLFDWELEGVDGSIEGDTLKLGNIREGQSARLIARYDGYGAMALLPTGTLRTLIDWDSPQTSPAATFASTAGVTGTVSLVPSEGGGNNKAIELNYDMTRGSTDTKAAYVAFPNGFALSGEPQRMQLRVRGDQSLNWLRAEMVDADGKIYYIDLAKTINWNGWKQLSVDLASHNMKYPIKLNRVYLASIKEGEDERNPIGSVAFDQISFLYQTPLPSLPKNVVHLQIGTKTIRINNQTASMDVAPQIIDSRTFVPIRFIADALGGEVKWEPNGKRITVIRGNQMIEMHAGQKEVTVNGKRTSNDVAPIIRDNRTLVPLRLLSEQFGWKVEWHDQTKEITLQ
jgi:exopolysaccharide biosynthesis protein